MLLQTSEKARAVFFFDKSNLVGELLYPEFESMLDGFVPAKEWSLRTMQAVYAEINHKFAMTSAVFFKIGFDDNGWVDGSWNLPLSDLARRAGGGPDLGAGPINLATADQSPVELLTPMLWNPDAKGRNSHFSQLKKAIQRNRLGLCFVAEGNATYAPVFNQSVFDAMEERLSSVLTQHLSEQRAQDLRMALQQVMEEHARVPVLHEVSGERVDVHSLEQVITDKEQSLSHMAAQLESWQERVTLLQQQLDSQVKKTEGLREYYEHKLERLQQEQVMLSAQSTNKSQTDVERIVREATQEFAELLQRKEIELLYRSEREEQLLAQLKRLQVENTKVNNPAKLDVLNELVTSGINLVTFQPGSEPVLIQPTDVADYIANPIAFTAKAVGVDERRYRAWLEHYQMPVCQHRDKAGNVCSHNLDRVGSAQNFVANKSIYCDRHRKP